MRVLTIMKVFKINNREIEVYVENDVIDANVFFKIGDFENYVQVQYNNVSDCYSTDLDLIKHALLANFKHEELYDDFSDDEIQAHIIESDLHCDLMNELLPSIVEYIYSFDGVHSNSYQS